MRNAQPGGGLWPPPKIHPQYPGSTGTGPYTALATVPEAITGERDGEHFHHRPRDEPFCLSKGKHKLNDKISLDMGYIVIYDFAGR